METAERLGDMDRCDAMQVARERPVAALLLNCTRQVANGGNVDLTHVVITSTDITVACVEQESMRVDEIYNCTGTYSVTWPDVTAGAKNSTVM